MTESSETPAPESHAARLRDSFYIPIRDPIAKHSRALIKALEKKIEDDLGMKVLVGMEKEMIIRFDEISINTADPITFEEAMVSLLRSEKISDTAGRIHSPIHSFYKENGECKFELTTYPQSLWKSIKQMDMACQRMEVFYQKKSTITSRGNSFKIQDVDFSPVYKDQVTAGLHVNLSLWDKTSGNNLLRAGKRWINFQQRNAVANKLYDYICHDTLLIAPSKEAYKRYNMRPQLFKRSADPDAIKDAFLEFHEDKNKPEISAEEAEKIFVEPLSLSCDRLEFRSPASDARHDLATLMMLTAVYSGLKSSELNITDHSKPAPNYTEATSRFERDSEMFKDLCELAGDDKELLAHVKQLRVEILKAAKDKKLTQPTLSELQAQKESGRG